MAPALRLAAILFAALTHCVVAQSDVLFHDGPNNVYSVELVSSGILRAPPAIVAGSSSEEVYVAVAIEQSASEPAGVMRRSQAAEASWTSFDEDCDPGTNAPFVEGDVVYQACTVQQGIASVGGVRALRASDGKLLWSWTPADKAAGDITGGTKIHAVTDSLIVVSTGPYAEPVCKGGSMQALNRDDGTPVWTVPNPWAITQGVVQGSTLFMAYHCGDVVALDMATGNPKWAKSWSGREPRNMQGTALVIFENLLYIAARGALRVTDLNGDAVWTHYLDPSDPDIILGPSVARLTTAQADPPYVYVGTAGGKFLAIQGRPQATVDDANVEGTPVARDTWLPIEQWRFAPEAPDDLAVQPRFSSVVLLPGNGILFVATGSGAIYELAMATGAQQSVNQWEAGSPAMMTLKADRLYFTRGRKLYVNTVPEPQPVLVTPATRAVHWEYAVCIKLDGVRYGSPEFRALVPRYEALVKAALVSNGISGPNTRLLVARTAEARPLPDPPLEVGSPPVDFTPQNAARRLLQDAAASAPAEANNTLFEVTMYAVPAEGDGTISRDDAAVTQQRLLGQGPTAMWAALKAEQQNDPADTFVAPTTVSLAFRAMLPRFEPVDPTLIEDFAAVPAVASQASGDGPAGAPVLADHGGAGLAGWKVGLIAACVCFAALLAAALAAFVIRRPRARDARDSPLGKPAKGRPPSGSAGSMDCLPVAAPVTPGPPHGPRHLHGVSSAVVHSEPASDSLPSWVSSADSIQHEARAMAVAKPVLGTLSEVEGRSGAGSRRPSSSGSRLAAVSVMPDVAEVMDELLCDVALRAGGRPPQAQSLGVAMTHVVKRVDQMLEGGKALFQDKYVMRGGPGGKALLPHSVLVFADGIAGGAYAIQFFCKTAHFRNEQRLHALPALAGLLANVDGMSPALNSRQEPLPRWKVTRWGRPLAAMLREERPSFLEVMRVLGQVSLRLEMMHAAGFAHRNVTMSNVVWIDEEQTWTLSDLSSTYEVGASTQADLLCINVRQTPPELVPPAEAGAQDFPVSATADAWALGLLGYELVTGAPLFGGDMSRNDVLDVLAGRACLPWEASLDAYEGWRRRLGPLGETILQLLERDPNRRLEVTAARPIWMNILRQALANRQSP